MAYAVLFHLNSGRTEDQRAALRNIENLLAEIPEAQVELVVQGDALPMVQTAHSPLAKELQALCARGVEVAVCRNTMRARGVSEEELLPGMRVVPSAVGELVRRQHEGMAYIKP
ncbi:MAG: DsrE family protein [Firmicutes bacterium]|nr:DsrE family protein [Bacillota bacterium]